MAGWSQTASAWRYSCTAFKKSDSLSAELPSRNRASAFSWRSGGTPLAHGRSGSGPEGRGGAASTFAAGASAAAGGGASASAGATGAAFAAGGALLLEGALAAGEALAVGGAFFAGAGFAAAGAAAGALWAHAAGADDSSSTM